MITNEGSIPSEINRFFISEESFHEIVKRDLGGDIKSVKIENGTADITVPTEFLAEILQKKYHKKIESLRTEDGDVGVKLSEESEPEESPDKTPEAREEEPDEELERLNRLRRTINGKEPSRALEEAE